MRALNLEMATGRFEAFNIGTGQGHSVLQVLRAVERATGRPVPHQIGARREGDPASLIAALQLAATLANADAAA